jgi:Na+/H+-dicarboxylate symporter
VPDVTPQQSLTKNTTTAASLIGLVAGLALGCILSGVTSATITGVAAAIEVVGLIWVRLLQMIVLPLVISQLTLAVITSGTGNRLGRMVLSAIALFIILLAFAAIFTLCVEIPFLRFIPIDSGTMSALRMSLPQSAQDSTQTVTQPPSITEWLTGIVPTNPFKSAANGELLQLIVFTVLFAMALTRVAVQSRDLLTKFFTALSETMFVMVHGLLRFAPIGVFAVALRYSRDFGAGVAGILLLYVVILCCLLIGFTVLLYPISVILGRIGLRSFAQSLYHAQLVAMSTRSSLASLPALLDGAKRKLNIAPEIVGFALPFSASAFKVNRTISGPAGLLFLAHLYNIELHPTQILTFVLTVMILSFSSPGIPQGGDSFKTLPAYLAAGIPVEGVILVKVVDVIPDIFKTLVNVTSYMTVAVLLPRLAGKPIQNELPLPETDGLAVRTT